MSPASKLAHHRRLADPLHDLAQHAAEQDQHDDLHQECGFRGGARRCVGAIGKAGRSERRHQARGEKKRTTQRSVTSAWAR